MKKEKKTLFAFKLPWENSLRQTPRTGKLLLGLFAIARLSGQFFHYEKGNFPRPLNK